jgi:outer membrane protein OmpA-like peptidoglycan-associated protein
MRTHKRSFVLITAILCALATSCSIRQRQIDDPLVFSVEKPERMVAYAKTQDFSPVELKPAFFETNTAVLTEAAKGSIRENAEWMKTHPTFVVEIEGLCDKRGSVLHNLKLGKERAESAQRYLLDQGIEESRILTISFGKEGSKSTDLASHRRATFKVYDPTSAQDEARQ